MKTIFSLLLFCVPLFAIEPTDFKIMGKKECAVMGSKCKCPCREGGACTCAVVRPNPPSVARPRPVYRYIYIQPQPSYTTSFASCSGGG